MQDEYVDYQQYGTYHAMIHRHYCMEVAPKEYRYDAFNWGLSAGSGPKQPRQERVQAAHSETG